MEFDKTYTVKMSVSGLNGELEYEVKPEWMYDEDKWVTLLEDEQDQALCNYAQDDLMQNICIYIE